MNLQETARAQLGFWHGTLTQMMGDCSDEILHRNIDGSAANSIATTYAHVVISEDTIVHAMLQGAQRVFESGGWAAKTGVPPTEVPPAITSKWAAAIKMNTGAFNEYAQKVYAATDAYLASLTDADLDRKMQGPAGETTVGFMVSVILATHFPGHAGEIAALKGVHGLKGLPF